MARSTIYHQYNALEAWENVNEHNKMIVGKFLVNLGAEGRSKQTIEKYTHNLKLFFQWVLDNRKNKEFHQIKKRDYSAWLNYLVNEQSLSPNRVRVLRSTVSSLSNFCENILAEDEDFPEYEGFRNSILKVSAPALELVRKKTFLTEEQIDTLVEQLFAKEQYQKCLYVMLSYITGASKAEIRQFKVSDFDEILEHEGKEYYKTHAIRCKGRGLQGKAREFIVLKDEIFFYLDMWLDERFRLDIPDELDAMFITKNSGKWLPVKDDTFNSWCINFSEILGVPVYPHAFRGSIATKLVNVDKKDMSKVQTLLGHKSLETTQHYIEDTSGEDIFDLFD